MSAKVIRKCSVISFILILFVLIAQLFGSSLTNWLLDMITNWLTNVIFDIHSATVYSDGGILPYTLMLLPAMLIPAILLRAYAKKENNVLLKRASGASLIVGGALFAVSLVDWIKSVVAIIYSRYLLIDNDLLYIKEEETDQLADRLTAYYTKLNQLTGIVNVITLCCSILTCILVLCLLVVWITNVLRSKKVRWMRKTEQIKPFVIILMLIPELFYWFRIIVYMVYSASYGSIDITTIYFMSDTIQQWSVLLISLVAALYILIFGIIRVKLDQEDDVDPDEIVYIHVENFID